MSAEDIEYTGDYKEFPTKESALDWLDNYLSLDERNNLIRALQQDSTTKNDLGVDAVSRKAVLNQIFYSTDNSGDVVLDSVLRERIERLPSVTLQEPRWIPVSERYPKIEDEYKYFLVTDDKGKVSVQAFFTSLDEEPQPYFSGMVNVIAWMPLPEPYEPQESEG